MSDDAEEVRRAVRRWWRFAGDHLRLQRLLRAVPIGWSVRTADADIAWLTPWAVTPRYPANLPDPTPQMADRALADARAILYLVKVDLDAKGWLA